MFHPGNIIMKMSQDRFISRKLYFGVVLACCFFWTAGHAAETSTNVVIAQLKYEGVPEFKLFSNQVTQYVSQTLAGFKNIKVLERGSFDLLATEQSLGGSSQSDADVVLGRQLTADYMIHGNISVVLEDRTLGVSYYKYDLSAKCVDTKTTESNAFFGGGKIDDTKGGLKAADAAVRAFSMQIVCHILKNASVTKAEFQDYLEHFDVEQAKVEKSAKNEIIQDLVIGAVFVAGGTALFLKDEKPWYIWTGIVSLWGLGAIMAFGATNENGEVEPIIDEIKKNKKILTRIYEERFGQ